MRGSPLILAACAIAMTLATGCVHHKKVQVAKAPRVGGSETGIASWYGVPYHGRRAANGEIYDMEKLTAAHRTLPFDTWVRVKNLTNDKVIDVRIQDRGPFVEGRIIDLSRAAARAIDMIGPGTAKVKLTVIKAPQYTEVPAAPVETKPPVTSGPPVTPSAPPPRTVPVPAPSTVPVPAPSTVPVPAAAAPPLIEPELYGVQVGAYQDLKRAETVRDAMRDKYGAARLVLRQGNPSVWRVLVGEEETIEGANALAERVRVEYGSGFVVRLDTAFVQ